MIPTRGTLARCAALLVFVGLATTGRSEAQQLTLSNPHWNITLSDHGYSDFLLDNTPGLEGREYLSGEWAGAIGYSLPEPVGTQSPQWFEPNFLFPDWQTGSSFQVMSPIAQVGFNATGLPIAESVIANTHLEVTLRHEMVDTVVGTPMGAAAASAGGVGGFIDSDRYVLRQTVVVRNRTTDIISNVQLFQFLHGYNSQRAVFDDRSYPGTLPEYRYDTTQAGVDPWAVGPSTSSEGLEDFLSFHSAVAPSAHEVGHYGIEGIDNHSMGKPSDGVHLSVEHNWLGAPYASRLNTDSFAPAVRWVSGAQRWELGSLAPGQSVSFDVLLSLRTGTRVTVGPDSSGGCNGGSGVPGGVDYSFSEVTESGSCFADFSRADDDEISARVASGEFEPIDFPVPAKPAQVWKMEFSGVSQGSVRLRFAYDPTLLPAGFGEDGLCVYQSVPGGWTRLAGTVDVTGHTITVDAAELSTFVLGAGDATLRAILATPDPVDGGTVVGEGQYAAGSSVTLSATPAAGYAFAGWYENGAQVSVSPAYTFSAQADRNLIASFVQVTGGHVISTASSPSNGGSTSGDGGYEEGAVVTVRAVPNSGYKFSKWREGEIEVSRSPDYTFTADASRVLTAVFKPVYVVDVTALPAGGGEYEVDPFYELGDTARLKAVPNDGFVFVNWTQNGIQMSDSPLYTFTVTGNRSLVANFAPAGSITRTIATSSSPAVGGTTSGAGAYPDGSFVTVTATPAAGYAFVNWTEGTTVVSTSASYGFTAGGNRSLVANFAPLTYTITTASSPVAGGTTSGAGTYTHGSAVTVTATPATGYAFVNWTEGATVVSTSASYGFTAGGNRSLVANFAPLTYTITTTSAPVAGGTTSGAGTYTHGSAVTVTAAPATGYAFVNWTEGATVVSTSASYGFTAGANRSLVANFAPVPTGVTITVTASPSTGGTVTGGGIYPSGSNVTVVAKPAAGYAFSNWTENGRKVSTSATYTFAAKTSRNLVANFRKLRK